MIEGANGEPASAAPADPGGSRRASALMWSMCHRPRKSGVNGPSTTLGGERGWFHAGDWLAGGAEALGFDRGRVVAGGYQQAGGCFDETRWAADENGGLV